MYSLAISYREIKNFVKSKEIFTKLYELNNNYNYLLGSIFFINNRICNWDKYEENLELIKNKILNKKTANSNIYIKKCFDVAFEILNKGFSNKFINGPINKSKFLDKKFLGMTEYISRKFNVSKNAMLIYNKEISVCPITTHLPLKLVPKKINLRM